MAFVSFFLGVTSLLGFLFLLHIYTTGRDIAIANSALEQGIKPCALCMNQAGLVCKMAKTEVRDLTTGARVVSYEQCLSAREKDSASYCGIDGLRFLKRDLTKYEKMCLWFLHFVR